LHRRHQHHRTLEIFLVLATIALVIQAGILLLALFEPGLPYLVQRQTTDSIDSPQFLRTR